MKRNINENYGAGEEVRLDLTAIAKDDRSVDFNDLADTFESMGADVDHDNNGHVIMVIAGLSKEKIESVLDSVVRLGAKPSYFVYDGDYQEDPSSDDFPGWDEVEDTDLDYGSSYRIAYEDVDTSGIDGEPLMEEEMAEHDEILRRCVKAVQKALNMKTIFCEDDIEDNLESLMADVVNDPDELTDDEYNELADILHEAWDSIDFNLDDEDDEYMPTFQKIRRGHHLEEKRKPCCPGGRTLNERLKAHNEKDQKKLDDIEANVKNIVKDLNGSTIGAHEAREAFKKLRAENAKLRKIEKEEGEKFNINDVAGAKKALGQIKKADPDNAKEVDKFQKMLTEKVNTHLKSGKAYLHENVSVKGVSFKDMTVFELKSLYDKTLAEKAELSKAIKNTLNESDFNATKVKLQKKNQLLNFIDEELTYRVVRQRCLKHLTEGVELNEDGGEITDEELANLFGPGQGEEVQDDNTSNNDSNNEENKEENNDESSEENNDDESEEVELSRIEITLKNREAAEDLKQACLDADIPEDAIEIEDVEEDDDENDEDDADENNEENDSEEEESDGSEDDSANESIYYGNILKLINEGEIADADNADAEEQPTDDQAAEDDDQDADGDDAEENEEDGQVKFILTNTDYASNLLKVLDDQYGISKDEFEEMIGAEIVEDDEESDDASDDEEAAEGGDDSSTGSEEQEEIDPADLFKGL